MAQTAQLRHLEVVENEAQRIFNLQRAAYLRHPYPSIEERRANLDTLERILIDNADAIADAINADFGHRAAEESKLLELFNCVDGIRYAKKKLAKWMKPQHRHVGDPLRDRQEPADPATQGRDRSRVAVELPPLPHDQPAHQHPRRRQPLHDQDGEQLEQPLPPPRRQVPRAVPRGHGRDPPGHPAERVHDAALRPHHLHRLRRRRPERHARRRGEPDAGDARARRQVADHHLPTTTTSTTAADGSSTPSS